MWKVAVNGVMAGCRPEYMPILVALVEAMADPRYGVEHSGNTPGAETLIVLNGPLIKELGFNYEQGAMRDGIQANTIDRPVLAAVPAQRRRLPATTAPTRAPSATPGAWCSPRTRTCCADIGWTDDRGGRGRAAATTR